MWPFLSAFAPVVGLGAAAAFLILFIRYSYFAWQRREERLEIFGAKVKQGETELACRLAEDLRERFDFGRKVGESYFELVDDEETIEQTLLNMRRINEMGLGPPEGAHVDQWHAHLGKLLPHIRIYGVDHARQERDKWYSL